MRLDSIAKNQSGAAEWAITTGQHHLPNVNYIAVIPNFIESFVSILGKPRHSDSNVTPQSTKLLKINSGLQYSNKLYQRFRTNTRINYINDFEQISNT